MSELILAGKNHKQKTIVEVGHVKIGQEFVVIAGPCSIESEEQLMASAKAVKEAGAQILRGGAYKPRTSPYSFQGLGRKGLELLHDAGKKYGMPVITEVIDTRDVFLICDYVDILQIGARNMQNFALLQEVGRTKKPVMLKRGMYSTIDEWLNCAEYIMKEGNEQVILCERGIRTIENYTRNTLDLSAVAALKNLTHLPVIVDPSHATGRKELIEPMSLAAIVAGAMGLMIEVHPCPEKALSDGPQSLLPEEFAGAMVKVRRTIDFMEELYDINRI